MTSPNGMLASGLCLAGFFAIRVLARWRVDRRQQQALTIPLVDPTLIETTLAPQPGDDADLLAELRDTLSHLNRRAYAEEFWAIDAQITALDAKLPKAARETLRRAIVRMLDTDDRWLQIVAARASVSLRTTDAVPRLMKLVKDFAGDSSHARFRTELEAAITALNAD
jgi:hypothetical protein